MVLIIEIALGIVLGVFILNNIEPIIGFVIKSLKVGILFVLIGIAIGVSYWVYKSIPHSDVASIQPAGVSPPSPTIKNVPAFKSAAKASANQLWPSDGYAGRISARIKPNIKFSETIESNPTAEVEIRTSPDGTIISRRLIRASGVRSWDEAVLNAIDKTEVLPMDLDGRVPTLLVVTFSPRTVPTN